MHSRYPKSHDVVIAGAGPVGLFLACELRLFGLSVVVLEQAADPRSPFKRFPFGRRGLWAPTLEALYRRGLLDAVRDAQSASDVSGDNPTSAHWMQRTQRPAGHFAGIPFFDEQIDSSRWPYRLPSPGGTSLMVEMGSFEAVLATRASALGRRYPPRVAVEGIGEGLIGVSKNAKR